jgi:hypothetical protein
VFVLIEATVIAQSTYPGAEFKIICGNRAAITERTQVFTGVKAETRCATERTHSTISKASTVGLRCILNEMNAFVAADVQRVLQEEWLSIEMNSDHSSTACCNQVP